MKNEGTTDQVRNILAQSAVDIRTQLALLDACIAANKLGWAGETLAEISKLASAGNPLAQAIITGAGAAGGAPVKPGARRPWVPASPEQIKEVVLKMIGHRPLVTYGGPIVVCTFNGYLLDIEKAKRIIDPLLELVKRAHVVLFQETNIDALRYIAKAAGYGVNASHRNNREQACGILYHPRLEWLGSKPVYHDYLLEVPDHPEFRVTLRPALQQRVRDISSGFVFDVVDLHTKSNLGGPDQTRPIRRYSFEQMVAEFAKQTEKSPYKRRKEATAAQAAEDVTAESAVDSEALTDQAAASAVEGTTGGEPTTKKIRPTIDYSAAELPLGPVIIGGDFNAPLEKESTTEIEPLLNAGFRNEKTPDNRPSYRYRTESGQFDGFFTRGLDGLVAPLWIPEFPEGKRDLLFYQKDFSDHLPVFLELTPPTATQMMEGSAQTSWRPDNWG